MAPQAVTFVGGGVNNGYEKGARGVKIVYLGPEIPLESFVCGHGRTTHNKQSVHQWRDLVGNYWLGEEKVADALLGGDFLLYIY